MNRISGTPEEVMDTDKEKSAADVDAIMRKYDKESNVRIWEGKPKIFVGFVLAAFSMYCIYVTLFANFLDQVRLSSFLGLVVVMGYLTYPAKKGHVKVNYMPWYDIVLMVLGAAAFLYYTFRAPALMTMRIKTKLMDPVYITAGIVGILVLCELCRRSVGVPILCVAGLFLGYTIWFYMKDGKLLSNVVHELFYNENGLLSTPVNVCSKYIVVFIIFGAFLEKTGISEFFISLANGLTGRYAGGPAKVAVISSALCGMVSGSSVGNTVTTGSITIPMMKKTGYDKNFSGAVEAAASTGGQIMPPIMGAAAFLMADYLGVPYSDIISRAILPVLPGRVPECAPGSQAAWPEGPEQGPAAPRKGTHEGKLPAAAAGDPDLPGLLQHEDYAVLRSGVHRGDRGGRPDFQLSEDAPHGEGNHH